MFVVSKTVSVFDFS